MNLEYFFSTRTLCVVAFLLFIIILYTHGISQTQKVVDVLELSYNVYNINLHIKYLYHKQIKS